MVPYISKNIRRPAGFTIIEIMVVVSIIALLIAILIPLLGKARAGAAKAATLAQMQALQDALQTYYNDHKMYPPSHLLAPRGNLQPGSGSLMLAEGITGFLPQPLDGAGPMTSGKDAVPQPGEPYYGFRTRNPSTLGGKVFGPYIEASHGNYKHSEEYIPDPNNPAQKIRAPDSPIPGEREFFVDNLDHDLLYFCSRGQPTDNPTQQLIFGGYNPGLHESFFFADDNKTTVKKSIPPTGNPSLMINGININTADPKFIQLIYPDANTSPNTMMQYKGGNVLGSDSYLIIGCGPDEKYFTADDLVVARP